MRRRVQIASFIGTLLLLLAAGRGEAADQKAILEKIKTHYQAAVAAYDDGAFEKTKSQLLEAIALSKENGLGGQKIVAQSYLLFGVLEVAGLKDTEAGIRYFAKALDISPAIQVPPAMATKAVLAAFGRAENQTPPSDSSGDKEVATKESSPAGDAEVEKMLLEKKAAPPSAAEKKRGGGDKGDKGDKAEKKDRNDRARDDNDRQLVDDLAQAKMGESQAEAEKVRLKRETQDKDHQLAELKGQIAQLEKEKQEQGKQLADAKGRLQQLEKEKPDKDRLLAETKGRGAQLEKEKQEQDKQLAATREAAKKENDANDKLKKEKLESDRQLADTKARLAQLTKEKQETDRQLAATRDTEKKERETREKLEKASQEAQARDKDRKSRDEQAKLEHDKLVDGPDLPGHFSEPIVCTIPDEIPAGADLFVHCLPHANVAAKVVAFYYRTGGTVLYNASTMDRTKKGWYTSMIPGSRLSGKLLQYYVEARDAKQAVAATNGKSSSPNIATIRPAGHAH